MDARDIWDESADLKGRMTTYDLAERIAFNAMVSGR